MKPYNPSPNGPRLVVKEARLVGFDVVCVSAGGTFATREECVATYANAIADDVHGAELTELRARLEKVRAAVEALEKKNDNSEGGWRIGDDIEAILDALRSPA